MGDSPRPKHYALPWPEPVKLFKWANNNSRRADGQALARVDFYKRAVRCVDRQPGEAHADFVHRAFLTLTRGVLVQRKADGATIPVWVEEMIAGEIGQQENEAAADRNK